MHRVARVRAANDRIMGAQGSRHCDAFRFEVDGDYTAALQARQLRHQLTHQTKANNRHRVPKAKISDSDRIEGNAPQRCKASLVETHTFRRLHHQLASGNNGFAVTGSLAAIGYAVPDGQIANRGMFLDDNPGSRISECCVFAEFGYDFPSCWYWAHLFHGLPDLP